MSETYYHNGTNRISCYGRENLAARICILMPGARKFSCAKIYAFTVVGIACLWLGPFRGRVCLSHYDPGADLGGKCVGVAPPSPFRPKMAAFVLF